MKFFKKYHIDFFNKNGFVLINNILEKKKILEIEKILYQLKRSQDDGRGLSEPGIKKSLIHSIHKIPRLIEIVENNYWFKEIPKKLLNCEQVYVWNAKSNLKKKFHGSAEYYHQDFIYWKDFGFKSNKMLNCMIFIDDHNHYNGGMWVFPKTHLKMYRHEKFLNINSLQKYHVSYNVLKNLNEKNPAIPIEAKAGSVLYFHSRLIHGSSHNISPNDRKILLYDISSSLKLNNPRSNRLNTFNRNERIKYERNILSKRIKALNS